MRENMVPRPILKDRDLLVPADGYSWRMYYTSALGEWSILVATPSGVNAYMRDANIDIYAGPLLVVREWLEPSITAWVERAFEVCASGNDLDRCRDCLRETFYWSHEFYLDEARRSNELARNRVDTQKPRLVVRRVVCDDGESLRRFWPADQMAVAATVRLEISIEQETHWYCTTVATVATIGSRLRDGFLMRPLIVASTWDSERIWEFLVAHARECDLGSLSDVRDLLRVRFEECAPLVP